MYTDLITPQLSHALEFTCGEAGAWWCLLEVYSNQTPVVQDVLLQSCEVALGFLLLYSYVLQAAILERGADETLEQPAGWSNIINENPKLTVIYCCLVPHYAGVTFHDRCG